MIRKSKLGELRNYAQAALLIAECHKRGLKL
jgi:hypothetical protein